MAYKALYRTYRPNTFDEVVGQQHIVKTLKNAVEQNKIAHAYLFCGPRGTGKTTIAKLLAKAVNCTGDGEKPCEKCANCIAIREGNHPDVVEFDAASNNGVDEIRNIIEKVKYSPIQGRYKVYIIDEVHMLSTGAFNALLKTLEEPPAHVIFVLATTEPHKVLPTIISRCQRYDFTKVSIEDMKSRLISVLENEHISYEEEAVNTICLLADGGMRDALSILDQAIAYSNNHLTADAINEIYGIATAKEKVELLEAVFNKDVSKILEKSSYYQQKGIDIVRLTANLVDILKEAVIYSYTGQQALLKQITAEQAKKILSYRKSSQLLKMVDMLMETSEKYRFASDVKSYFEVVLLKMMDVEESIPVKVVEKTQNESAPLFTKQVETVKVVESAPAKEEVKAVATVVQEVKTPVKTLAKPKMDLEFYLSLLVRATKADKEVDKQKWNNFGRKMNKLEYARITNLLRNSDVLASGSDFIFISTDYSALVNQINDNMENVARFFAGELDIDKYIFPICIDDFKKVTSMFIERRKNGTLPEPAMLDQVSNKEEAQTEQESPIEEDPVFEKLVEVFGKEKIEIQED